LVLIDRKEHDISGANVQQAIQMYKLTFLRKFAILIKSKDIDGGFEQIRSDIFYALCRRISDLFFCLYSRSILCRNLQWHRKQICRFGL